MKKIEVAIPNNECSWKSFDRSPFPGGVHVTFVMVETRTSGVVVLKPGRDIYEMPSLELGPGESLDLALRRFLQVLQDRDVHHRGVSVEEVWALETDGNLHLVCKLGVGGLSGKLEVIACSKAYMVESALWISNPVSAVVPSLLGWRGATWPVTEEEKMAA